MSPFCLSESAVHGRKLCYEEKEARLELIEIVATIHCPNLTKLCSRIKHRSRRVERAKRWSALAVANNTFARPKYIHIYIYRAFKRGSWIVFCPPERQPYPYTHRFNIHPNLCSNNPRWWIGHLEAASSNIANSVPCLPHPLRNIES